MRLVLAAAMLVVPRLAVEASHAPQRPGAAPVSVTADRAASGFRMASLNLRHSLAPAAVAHDVTRVLRAARPSVIGFQERGGSRRVLLAALPDHWALRMSARRPGADHNPVAFDTRVWAHLDTRAHVLTTTTWPRAGGAMAVDQYGVVVDLEHLETGHRVRVISFHMPPAIHHQRSGGPNWRLRDRVAAFWRMAARVRALASRTPDGTQLVVLCDCNVRHHRDRTRLLVRGKLTRPLRLANNYTAARRPAPHRRIDYVMSPRRSAYRIVDGWSVHGLRTDHPAVVARFRSR